MRKHIHLTVFLGVLILAFTACEISSTNENPNQATSTGLNNLLPHAQANLAYGLGGNISQYNSVLMQQMAGTERVHGDVGRYNFSSGIAGTVWDQNLYSGAMNNLYIVIQRAEEEGAWHHRGVAKILMANALGMVTSLWNHVPYTEAFQGAESPQPAYDDSQEVIYPEIQRLLSAGVEDLRRSVGPMQQLGNSDLIYGGNLAMWEMAANALSARYHNHSSKVDPQGSATAVLNALGRGTFTSNADNMSFPFGTEEQQANPWYTHNVSAFGTNTAMSEFFVDLLLSIDDPRLPHYAAPNSDGNYVGQTAGVLGREGISELGNYYNRPEGPFHYITYSEVKFLEAEANYRLGNFGPAAEAMNEGIIASLEQVTGDADAAYVAAQASETAASMQDGDGLTRLMTHKYVALFLQQEVFSDWRRTGIPALQPADQNLTGNVIPRRWPYPQSEINANRANVDAAGAASLTDRVWWDVP